MLAEPVLLLSAFRRRLRALCSTILQGKESKKSAVAKDVEDVEDQRISALRAKVEHISI